MSYQQSKTLLTSTHLSNHYCEIVSTYILTCNRYLRYKPYNQTLCILTLTFESNAIHGIQSFLFIFEQTSGKHCVKYEYHTSINVRGVSSNNPYILILCIFGIDLGLQCYIDDRKHLLSTRCRQRLYKIRITSIENYKRRVCISSHTNRF